MTYMSFGVAPFPATLSDLQGCITYRKLFRCNGWYRRWFACDSQAYKFLVWLFISTKFGERAFSFSGPSAWNALPADIRDETCTAAFNSKLKTFYFSLAFDCIWRRFYVTTVMYLRSYSSAGGTTKFLNLELTPITTASCSRQIYR